jgi:Putative beta-lactamase-inhibitor-like, PepSY-like
MKKVITQVIMITFLSVTVLAQPASKELPKEIAGTFSSKYPAVAIKNWNLKNDTYTVKFRSDDKNHFAYYTANGTWLRTETSYAFTFNLPAEIKNGWKNCKYKAWIPQGIKHIESANSDWYIIRVTNVLLYDAEHGPEKETFDLFFSKNGDLVKKEDRPWGSKNL